MQIFLWPPHCQKFPVTQQFQAAGMDQLVVAEAGFVGEIRSDLNLLSTEMTSPAQLHQSEEMRISISVFPTHLQVSTPLANISCCALFNISYDILMLLIAGMASSTQDGPRGRHS